MQLSIPTWSCWTRSFMLCCDFPIVSAAAGAMELERCMCFDITVSVLEPCKIMQARVGRLCAHFFFL